MKIGIDISQIAYQETGVANFLSKLILNLSKVDKENQYILFYSSLRRSFQFSMCRYESHELKYFHGQFERARSQGYQFALRAFPANADVAFKGTGSPAAPAP